MEIFSITIGLTVLGSFGFAQSPAPSAFGKVKVATLPGVILFGLRGPTETPVTRTKDRALDHIGFEVKDLA